MHEIGTEEGIETEEIRRALVPVIDQAREIVVTTPEDAQVAFNIRGMAKGWVKRVEDFFEPHKKRAKAAHAGLCEDERRELAPALQVIQAIDAKLSAYQAEERRKGEAERVRLEAEAKRKAEDTALAQASAAEANGDKAEASAILAEPVSVPVVETPKAAKLDGGSFRTVYFAEVVDIKTLCSEIAAGRLSTSFVSVDQGALNKFAAATKGEIKNPALRFGSRQVPVGR